MDFIKKNWEKVLLGAVLIGLLVAVIGLPIKIASERAEVDQLRDVFTQQSVSEIPDLDLSEAQKALDRTHQPVSLDLTSSNRVFNPVQWKRSPSGQLLRVNSGNEIGVTAVDVQDISPLYLIISLDSILTSDSGSRYAIGVVKQAGRSRRARTKRQTYAAVGEKNETFLLRGVNGPAAQPSSIELELSDTGERVTLSQDEPYRRIDGYMATLSYPLESRTWADKRVGDVIPIERKPYNIVAITEDEVVFSASSGKKTALKFDVDNSGTSSAD